MYSVVIMDTNSKLSESDLRKLATQNRRIAKRFWAGRLSASKLDKLVHLTRTLGLCVNTVWESIPPFKSDSLSLPRIDGFLGLQSTSLAPLGVL
jgi:hypothetical protein